MKTISLIFINILIAVIPVTGGGFQINMLNTKNTGMAGTATAYNGDASVVFYNPGAMSFAEYNQISAGVSVTIPSVSYLSPFTGNYNNESSIYAPIHLYGTWKLNDKTAVGLSVNTPYKQRSKWSDDWSGRYIVTETKLNTYYIQPAISYAVSEKISIGGGPVIAFGNSYIKKYIPLASSQNDIALELDGSSTGFGFNIGVFYVHNENFSAGLSYRSGVNMNIKEGDANFNDVPASLSSMYPSSTSFSTEYKLPGVLSAGIATRITRELLLCVDFNFTFWNTYDSLTYEFDDNSDLNLGSGKFYKNAFAVRLGAEYTLNEFLALRAGIALDKTPVQDDYVSPDNPDADRFMFSLGGSLALTENLSIDLAYMLQNIKEREVSNPETNFGGNYKSLLNIAGLTLNYKF